MGGEQSVEALQTEDEPPSKIPTARSGLKTKSSSSTSLLANTDRTNWSRPTTAISVTEILRKEHEAQLHGEINSQEGEEDLKGQPQRNNETVKLDYGNIAEQPDEEDLRVQLKEGDLTVQLQEGDLTSQPYEEDLIVNTNEEDITVQSMREHLTDHSEIDEDIKQMQQIKQEVEELKKERDLYLGKLRQVELSCSGSKDTGVKQVLNILHGREDEPAVPDLETALLPSHKEMEDRCEPVTMIMSTHLHFYTTLWLRKSPSPSPGE